MCKRFKMAIMTIRLNMLTIHARIKMKINVVQMKRETSN
jgi:hypothetical protein